MTTIRSTFVLSFAAFTAACPAQVTMTPLTSFAGDGWLEPGEVSWLSSTIATERSIAYSAAANELYVASRGTGVNVRILNAATGTEINVANSGLDMTGVSGGIFPINCVSVAEDGVIYGCNLCSPVSGTSPFKIYRWPDSNSAPELVFTSSVITSGRMGDTFDAIGSGPGTLLVAGESNTAGTGPRNGYAVFTAPPPDSGVEFTGLLVGFLGADLVGGDFRAGITFTDADSVIGSQGNGGFKFTSFLDATGEFEQAKVLTNVRERPMDFIVLGGRPLLATIETNGNTTTPDAAYSTVRIYDFTVPDTPVMVASGRTATTYYSQGASGAGTGSVAWAKLTDSTANLYALSTNNGIQAFAVSTSSDATPPSIATPPASRTVFERGQTTFTVAASGTPPFIYQWLKDGAEIENATGVSFTINPVTAASAGEYSCRVSNAAPPAVESTPAVLTVDPGVNTGALTQEWQLPPGSRPYLTTGDFQRGLAHSPAAGKLYLVSRTSATDATLHVLDAAGGTDLGVMDVSGITGGTFVLNKVAVAEDGVILACNLSNTADGGGFKIYQWPDDHPATPPGVVYEGNPAGLRIGDSFAVRGSGAGTQFLAGTNAAGSLYHFVLFTADAFGFLTPHPVTVTGAADRAFSLSIAFGPDNTVWGKSNTGGVTAASLTVDTNTDPPSVSATLLANYGDSVIPTLGGALAVDGVNGFLAHIHTGNSDNVRLYQLPLPFPAPPPAGFTWLDQEFYSTDNANDNHTGQLVFGSGRLFALNTNNGLACYTIAGLEPPGTPPVITDVTQTGGSVVFKLRGTPGKTYLIEKSSQLTPEPSWTPDGTVTQNAAEETVTRPIPAGTPRLYWRAREQ